MRQAVFVEDGKVTNLIVLEEGQVGDHAIEALGCIEVTHMNPVPQIGWDFDGVSFSYTPTPDEIERKEKWEAHLRNLESAKTKLAALGLTEEEAKAVLGL